MLRLDPTSWRRTKLFTPSLSSAHSSTEIPRCQNRKVRAVVSPDAGPSILEPAPVTPRAGPCSPANAFKPASHKSPERWLAGHERWLWLCLECAQTLGKIENYPGQISNMELPLGDPGELLWQGGRGIRTGAAEGHSVPSFHLRVWVSTQNLPEPLCPSLKGEEKKWTQWRPVSLWHPGPHQKF